MEKSNLQRAKYLFSFHTSCPKPFIYIYPTLPTLMDTKFCSQEPYTNSKNRGHKQHSSQGFTWIQAQPSIPFNFSKFSEAPQAFTDQKSLKNQHHTVTVYLLFSIFDFNSSCISNEICLHICVHKVISMLSMSFNWSLAAVLKNHHS